MLTRFPKALVTDFFFVKNDFDTLKKWGDERTCIQVTPWVKSNPIRLMNIRLAKSVIWFSQQCKPESQSRENVRDQRRLMQTLRGPFQAKQRQAEFQLLPFSIYDETITCSLPSITSAHLPTKETKKVLKCGKNEAQVSKSFPFSYGIYPFEFSRESY